METENQVEQAKPAISAESVITAFVMLRDQRSELKRTYEEADDVLKAKQTKLKQWLLIKMQEVGSESFRGGTVGTAYRQLVNKFSASDWNLVWAFIKENDRFDMLQKRLGEKAMSDFLEETGDLPPGVSVHQEYDVVIRRS